ncbi:hypothetical protein [Streptomyces nigrescens]|uniref:Uncharacterized protein n=1 Tax=Streptomyces nigrescens TaxID=1920 RepID=A0ABY7IYM6_STRNI|nr:hypothetical protein [Streptomyces nigrescens]WAU04082.1 hypothetical protein STRNI_002313 [Streptomyces nigrescens]
MPDSTPYAVALAEDIARRLHRLSEHLAQAPPRQAAQILGKVLDADEGVLGRMTGLMATGSQIAQHRAQAGSFPPEVFLAVGRAANELHDIALDLDEHADDIHRLATPPTAAHPAVAKPVASDMVVRRHR